MEAFSANEVNAMRGADARRIGATASNVRVSVNVRRDTASFDVPPDFRRFFYIVLASRIFRRTITTLACECLSIRVIVPRSCVFSRTRDTRSAGQLSVLLTFSEQSIGAAPRKGKRKTDSVYICVHVFYEDVRDPDYTKYTQKIKLCRIEHRAIDDFQLNSHGAAVISRRQWTCLTMMMEP